MIPNRRRRADSATANAQMCPFFRALLFWAKPCTTSAQGTAWELVRRRAQALKERAMFAAFDSAPFQG
jgi:hypothetical protein